MSVRVKYNHDLKFRRWAAFLRMYRAGNPRVKFLIEMFGMGFGAVFAAVYWFRFADSTERFAIYLFFTAILVALYYLARLLRVGVMVLRVRKVLPEKRDKEYFFDERGFSFGPVDEAGNMVDTRWDEVDNVYFMEKAVYILCMGRKRWAAVDPSLMTEGTPEELTALIRQKLPKRKIVGSL